MASLFSRIVAGELPAYRILEDDHHLAFLDINPLVEGHTLVIPKREVDYLFDLEDEEIAAIHLFAKKVARAIDAAIACERVGVAVVGLEIPHAHIHLIPINAIGDINFKRPKLEFSEEAFETTRKKIRAQLQTS
mgnify:CR=1 FL=1